MIPAQRKILNAPRSVIAVSTMAVNPAAGPDTEILELLIDPMTRPPTIPAMTPDKGVPLKQEQSLNKGEALLKILRVLKGNSPLFLLLMMFFHDKLL